MFVVEREAFFFFLLRSFLLGALFSQIYLLFTPFRVRRSLKKSGFSFFIQILEDVFFMFLLSFLNVLLIFEANRGQVRIIALLSEGLGFLLVYHFLSPFFKRGSLAFWNFIEQKVKLPLKNRRIQKKKERTLKKISKNIGITIEKEWERDLEALFSEK